MIFHKMKATIDQIYQKIAPHLRRTPLIKQKSIDEATNCSLWFKMENEQLTGSFKFRGVLSKFDELKNSIPNLTHVVAASTGNHALAVCHAAKAHNCSPIIFVPETISNSKLEKLKAHQIEIHQAGAQSGETEQIAIKWAQDHNYPLIHPYSDPAVIKGQGTIGLELDQQLEQFDAVFVPVGGGGLISGIAAYLKDTNRSVRIVGVQPKNACEMADSIEKGFIVPPSKLTTISDGTAGGLDPQTVTYAYCRDLVDDFVLVEEVEIVKALVLMEKHLGIKVEPSAGLALAGILKLTNQLANKECLAIVCGGNIDPQSYHSLLKQNY